MASNVWFTSDLHLGHPGTALKHRGFHSVEEHDEHIIAELNRLVKKKEKLFILGDVVWSNKHLKLLDNIVCKNKELIIGNHDQLMTKEYLKHFTKVHGFRKFRNMWLSHCPIHPQEMYRCVANVHGHLHNGAATPPLPFPYINVNVDYNRFKPVNLDEIEAIIEKGSGNEGSNR